MAGGGQPFESIVRPRVGLTAGKGVNGVLSVAVEQMAEAAAGWKKHFQTREKFSPFGDSSLPTETEFLLGKMRQTAGLE